MPQKGGAGTVASLGSGCFCLLRFSVPPGPAHLAAAWLHLSEGLTQYCQGWLAPNWNDTFFFSLQALQLLLHVGVDSMSKQMFSLCFFLLKRKKKNHTWEPADKAEPATQFLHHRRALDSSL